MRKLLLLSVGVFIDMYAMQQEGPVLCGSSAAGHCFQLVTGCAPERVPLLAEYQRGNIQNAPGTPPPESIEMQCYRRHKKKIWCCGACCCLGCSCITATSISNVISSLKTIGSWFN